MSSLTEVELEKIVAILDNEGAGHAVNEAIRSLKTGRYASYIPLELCERLLRMNEHAAAGNLLAAIKDVGMEQSAIFAEVYSKWLWCEGNRDAAVEYLREQDQIWDKPYLKETMEAFILLLDQHEDSG